MYTEEQFKHIMKLLEAFVEASEIKDDASQQIDTLLEQSVTDYDGYAKKESSLEEQRARYAEAKEIIDLTLDHLRVWSDFDGRYEINGVTVEATRQHDHDLIRSWVKLSIVQDKQIQEVL